MKLFKHLAAGLIAAFAVATPSAASTYSIDYTDLWINPNESGWGLNLVQQYDTMFATIFLYGPDGSDRWFSASALTPAGGNSYSGQLVQTTGPYFGAGSFNSNAVTRAVVGTMTVSFGSSTSGTLSYTVNGVSVTKSIVRFTFRNENLTGNYIGGLTANSSGCNGVANGPVLVFDNLTVTQSGASVTMRVIFFNSSTTQSQCNFQGAMQSTGKTSLISGTYSCVSGSTATNQGSFTISNITSSQTGFSGTYTGADQFCSSYTGQFGGVKDVL
jgi:hypothetical protein